MVYLASRHPKLCFKCYSEYKIKESTENVLEIIKICLKNPSVEETAYYLIKIHSASASLASAQIKKHLPLLSDTKE